MCLNYLIIHSTNTREGKDVKIESSIKNLYSDIVDISGNIINLLSDVKSNRTVEWDLNYNNKDINNEARHIAYTGGVNKENTHAKDTRTNEQKETLEIYIKYMIKRHPNIIIAGYNQFKEKSSPSFKVNEWLEKIGVKEKNIFK
jgi:N-acetylmuramoyl-L-alanine amidase|tara:strand:- start:95 stop:526 length:432 start_codon:yes stop_codon:yes gene_type:complete